MPRPVTIMQRWPEHHARERGIRSAARPLILFTIIAGERLSSRHAPIARDLLQSMLLVLLAMPAALIATLAMRP